MTREAIDRFIGYLATQSPGLLGQLQSGSVDESSIRAHDADLSPEDAANIIIAGQMSDTAEGFANQLIAYTAEEYGEDPVES